MRKYLIILAGVGLLLMPLTAVTAQDVEIGGLIDVGYVYNMEGLKKADRNVGTGFNAADNDFQVSLAQLQISKEADPVGFDLKLDLLGVATQGGLDQGDDLYVQVANVTYNAEVGNGLTLVVGKFESVVGLERIESANNAHMTHGLLYGVTPKTHTGIRAIYPVMDNLSVALGLNNGAGPGPGAAGLANDNNKTKSVEFQVAYNPMESLSTILNIEYGPESALEGDATLAIDLIATYDVTEELSVSGEYLYASVEDNDGVGSDADIQIQGLLAGATYWLTDMYGASARFEYVDVEGGAETYGITITGTAKLTDDLVLRLEFRHDEAVGSVPGAAAVAPATVGTLPYASDVGAGNEDSQNIIGLQLIYTF